MRHFIPSRFSRTCVQLAGCALLASVSACGGGDGGGGFVGAIPPEAPAAIDVTGQVVIDQGINNAKVCIDMNANGGCDAGEPSSDATAADGGYRIRHQPTDAAQAADIRAAALLAVIGPDAIDAGTSDAAASQAYVLSAPAGKAGQINPLTTLVQGHMAQTGASLADAETAVVRQLGISVAKIYDYQDDPSSSAQMLPDTARTAAKVTAYARELGADLRTFAANAAPVAVRQLGLLSFTDSNNYQLRIREADGVADAEGYQAQVETRSGKAGGAALTHDQLYAASLQLTDRGWSRCDGADARRITRGNPSRVDFCDGNTLFLGFGLPAADIAERKMAEVIAQMQSGDERLESEGVSRQDSVSGTGLAAALGAGSFPLGAQLSTSVSIQLNQPRFINSPSTDAIGFSSLAALVASRPVANVNLATSAGTVGGLGPHGDNAHSLRLAFVDGQTVQLYRCETDANTLANPHDCEPLQTSAYAMATVGGVQVLGITDFPASPANPNQLRGYAEYDGGVYFYRQNRPATDEGQVITYAQRLNGVAWDAMKATLGL